MAKLRLHCKVRVIILRILYLYNSLYFKVYMGIMVRFYNVTQITYIKKTPLPTFYLAGKIIENTAATFCIFDSYVNLYRFKILHLQPF